MRVHLAASWLDKNDANIKAAQTAFTVGLIVANKSFVDAPRSITRLKK
jgi:hypothetical protein